MNRAPSSADPRVPAAPSDVLPYVHRLDSLEEISAFLGTFRERLRIARAHEQAELQDAVKVLEGHFWRRRAELS